MVRVAMTAKNKAKIRAEKKRTVEGICYRVNYSRASGMPCGSNDLWFDLPFSIFRASWCPDSYGYSYCSLWEFERLCYQRMMHVSMCQFRFFGHGGMHDDGYGWVSLGPRPPGEMSCPTPRVVPAHLAKCACPIIRRVVPARIAKCASGLQCLKL